MQREGSIRPQSSKDKQGKRDEEIQGAQLRETEAV